jgi:hypothetical protein
MLADLARQMRFVKKDITLKRLQKLLLHRTFSNFFF